MENLNSQKAPSFSGVALFPLHLMLWIAWLIANEWGFLHYFSIHNETAQNVDYCGSDIMTCICKVLELSSVQCYCNCRHRNMRSNTQTYTQLHGTGWEETSNRECLIQKGVIVDNPLEESRVKYKDKHGLKVQCVRFTSLWWSESILQAVLM